MSIDVRKKNLAKAIMDFQKGNLYENGLKYFEASGYNTIRTMPVEKITIETDFPSPFHFPSVFFRDSACVTIPAISCRRERGGINILKLFTSS